ncbi:MAG TPA: fused MFS/spermidine synthase [Chthoniobacterales bacterium]|nr:fused MFS/spermidine synthase [Chthoniobacterales bacterium]
MVWLREFRLFFGASTAANAAVLGIFMGGLGFGSLILGKRSENKQHPLQFYAKLELMIAASAALTPLLIFGMRLIYRALGGTLSMGLGFGSVVRLVMAAIVLGGPTFLMGGTLPAVARATVRPNDVNRRPVALLYGLNTLGAVVGTSVATFYFFEAWGNHITLLLTTAFNAWIAVVAFQISRELPALEPIEFSRPPPDESTSAPPVFTFVASAIAGFAFLLMEMVWYRMLSSLLGGSTFTFGLILAVALFGIGLGGLVYAMWFGGRLITLRTFAIVCALEAFCMAFPYALGDRIALLAMLLRPLGVVGFYGFVVGWVVICGIVVAPASIAAGIQFPMLIALLGKGRLQVGTHVGITYAWNTLGAIIGSLAGGFGFLPLFSAPGVWRLVVVLLSVLAAAAALIDLWRQASISKAIISFGSVALPLLLLTATGPTAFWRHSEIGVGRLAKYSGSKNEFHDLMNTSRRDILWEKDGLETSVALSKSSGLNFIVNGKCDGSLRVDAGTQIMSGLIAAALHSRPTQALVVGLGTGSTAGWMAAVPSIENVDVFELEPAILRVAKECAPMNHDALANPKVHVTIGDARELLMATRKKYDLIVSEPSNPYRAGIANMFTREYYQAAAGRLNPDGIFAQWVQAYEVDDNTIETVYATLGSVFPNVETWQTEGGDLLLVGTAAPRTYNANELRERIAAEPFKTGLRQAWHVNDFEGFLAHFVASNKFTQKVRQMRGVPLNTDDRTILEFAFARNVDLHNGFNIGTLRSINGLIEANRLPLSAEDVDWHAVDLQRVSMLLGLRETPNPNEYGSEALQSTATAYADFLKGNLNAAYQEWRRFRNEPNDLNELLMVAECAADQGKSEANTYIEQLRSVMPNDADAISVRFLWRQGRIVEAVDLLGTVLQRLHTDPWLSVGLADRTLTIAKSIVDQGPNDAALTRIYQALQSPFSVYACDTLRFENMALWGVKLDKGQLGKYTAAAMEQEEPFIPWQGKVLQVRNTCYKAVNSPRAAQANRDLNEFLANEPSRLGVARSAGKSTGATEVEPTPTGRTDLP